MLKISVITINYNNKEGLKKTIESVIDQTYPYIEYIIIDGGSTDGSVDIIKQKEDKISYWISENDNGVYNALNKGILKASGNYLIFLNSGDAFTGADVLNSCYNLMQEFPYFDIYYADMLTINHLNFPDNSVWKHPSKLSLLFFKNNTINHQASLINAELFKEYGLYPEKYKLASDYWLWLICFINDKKFKHLNFPMVTYDFSGLSAADDFKSYSLERKLIWESLVPAYVQEIIEENEHLIKETENYKHLTGYKLLKVAIRLNNQLQKYRSIK
jgi:glycosyltransferase involved in cell wall biosynthesis